MTAIFTSREFNQDAGRAKRAAAGGPVFITDRGRRAHVLMTIEDYQRLAGGGASIVDLLADKAAARIDVDFPRPRARTLRATDFA